jgi:hypothetical protein
VATDAEAAAHGLLLLVDLFAQTIPLLKQRLRAPDKPRPRASETNARFFADKKRGSQRGFEALERVSERGLGDS